MSVVLLWIVTVLYVGQAGVAAAAGNYPAAMIVAGYALAGVGLIWSLR